MPLTEDQKALAESVAAKLRAFSFDTFGVSIRFANASRSIATKMAHKATVEAMIVAACSYGQAHGLSREDIDAALRAVMIQREGE